LADEERCRLVSLFFFDKAYTKKSLFIWKTISDKPWEFEGEALNRPQA